MKDLIFLKRILNLILFIYFVVGLSTGILFLGREYKFTPFYSWFLFVHVPNKDNLFTVQITEYNGIKINPSLLFSDAWGIVPNPKSSIAYNLIQRLGLAVKNKSQSLKFVKKEFEKKYLKPSIVYQISHVKYQPLKWIQTNRVETETLATFTVPK